MVIPKTTASKDVGRSVPRRYRFSPRISATAEVLGRLVHDFVGRITRDALLVGAVFHVVPQPLKAGAYSAEGMLEEPIRTFLIIELVDQRDPIEVVLQRTLDEVADSALMVAQTGVGIWKGGLQKADDQVGIGDFHAIDRDERHLSTRRIANALLGDGFEGDSLETKMSCQLRRKRRQRRDPARDVGIEN